MKKDILLIMVGFGFGVATAEFGKFFLISLFFGMAVLFFLKNGKNGGNDTGKKGGENNFSIFF
jgi:hypothetical protein